MSDTVRYDDRTPRLFFVAAIIWAVVGMLVGVLAAAMLFLPELNVAPYLTFGRLRPLQPSPPPPAPPGQTGPWYFRTANIVLALACIGPLALPMIWFRPKTPVAWKIGLTIAILGLTWLLIAVMRQSIRSILDFYQLMDTSF